MRLDADGNFYIRQSWLDEYMRDPERARLKLVHPELDGPSDATALGTAAHAGCETLLEGGTDDDALVAIEEALDHELSLTPFYWNKYKGGRAELLKRARNCYVAWRNDIFPIVPQPGVAEFGFCVHVFDYELPDHMVVKGDGIVKVFIEGTIDWSPTTINGIWDWKFPGRDYRQAEKQKSAIQPTIYTLAAVLGGLKPITDFEYTYPMPFTYGLGVTLANSARAQMFTVERHWGHANFALDRMHQAVDMYVTLGLEHQWPINDDHFLCSDKWCPYWAKCKGKHLNWRDLKVPERYQEVSLS